MIPTLVIESSSKESSSSSPTLSSTHVQLCHDPTKGRFIRARRTIQPDECVWQERVTLTCSSSCTNSDDTMEIKEKETSAEPSALESTSSEIKPSETMFQTIFTTVLSSLQSSSEISPTDLAITLHVLRSLLEHDSNTSFKLMLQHLQSRPHPPVTSHLHQRFQRLTQLSERIAHSWKAHIQSAPSSVSSQPSPKPTEFDLTIRPELILSVLGILQLNSHRCAPLLGAVSASTTAIASSDPITGQPPSTLSPSPHGKGISLQLSMLEHDCEPNVKFTTEWIRNDKLPDNLSNDSRTESPFLTNFEASGVTYTVSNGRTETHSLVLSIHALRLIESNESLSISYYPCRVRTLLRQQHLQRQYGFICTCCSCTGPDATRSFHCCHPALESDLSFSSSPSSPSRCLGLIQPIGVGTTASAFQCQSCHRGVNEEQFKKEICGWEQALLRDSTAYQQFLAADKHRTYTLETNQFPLYPHPTHYLLMR